MPARKVLMHKDVPVAILEMEEGVIEVVYEVLDCAHLPVGVSGDTLKAIRNDLRDWWALRAIPSSRGNIRFVLQGLGVSSPLALLDRHYALSLTDHYWVRDEQDTVSWGDVNFFDHPFTSVFGDVLIGLKDVSDLQACDRRSPDVTSSGDLIKRWVYVEGQMYLAKWGSGIGQQPFNEAIASDIAEALGIPHVSYALRFDGRNEPYSLCPCVTDKQSEFVTAWQIVQSGPAMPKGVSEYDHYLSCAQACGIDASEMIDKTDKMIVFDYLIGNVDRHYNNFGILRNPDSLAPLAVCPLFDNGSSLQFNKYQLRVVEDPHDVDCMPFSKRHDRQVKFVRDWSWLDLSRLSHIEGRIVDVLGLFDRERALAVAKFVSARKDALRRIQDRREIAGV